MTEEGCNRQGGESRRQRHRERNVCRPERAAGDNAQVGIDCNLCGYGRASRNHEQKVSVHHWRDDRMDERVVRVLLVAALTGSTAISLFMMNGLAVGSRVGRADTSPWRHASGSPFGRPRSERGRDEPAHPRVHLVSQRLR